tara:strand:+ start:272 stop:514 length:243 start_codon:yes stop_codon:yes gene_type:complete
VIDIKHRNHNQVQDMLKDKKDVKPVVFIYLGKAFGVHVAHIDFVANLEAKFTRKNFVPYKNNKFSKVYTSNPFLFIYAFE